MGAFIWFKYYVLVVLCNLKEQLNFEYFKDDLSISILELQRNFPNYESEENHAGVLST